MAKARRAKKSKIPKKLLILPAIVIGAGAMTVGLNPNIGKDTAKIIGSNVADYEACDFVKDIFTQGNTKYLPIRLDDHEDRLTRQDLINEFNARGLSVKSISYDKEPIINGTTVTTTDDNVYTILIYGDVNCDGVVNVLDAQKIVQHLLYGNGYELTGIKRLAANVDDYKNDVINVRDSQKIIQFIVSNRRLMEELPVSDIQMDNEKPVIHITGESNITMRVFDEYDLKSGVTVTDNLQYLDPNIKSRLEIDKGDFDPNKPGKYTITYNVSDAKGNRADPVTRTIEVVDYIKELELEKGSDFNTEYTDGEKISLDGLTVYEVLAWAGKQETPIDNNKISITPDKASIDKQEFTISYGGASKVIPITVTKNVAIITLNRYLNEDANGTALVRCGTEYIEPGFTAVDKYDGTYEYPDVNPENKFQVSIVITDDSTGNVISRIPSDKAGTYTITYTVTNSQGNPNKKIRKVKMVDYIVSARIDASGVTKTNYIDGETLSFEGIKVYANYASNPSVEKEITASLSSDLADNKAVYDRIYTGNNRNKAVKISCSVFDGVEDTIQCQDTIYINITKQFETIVNIISVPNEIELYKRTRIARLESGTDEAEIDVNVLKAKNPLNNILNKQVVNKNGDTSFVEFEKTADGYVDVYMTAVAPANTAVDGGTYVATIIPPIGDTQKLTLNVKTKENNSLNYIDIGDLTYLDGSEVRRFTAGQTVQADLKFYHNYEYVNKSGVNRFDKVEISEVTASQLSSVQVVEKANNNPVSGINSYFMSGDKKVSNTNFPSAKVERIQIEAGAVPAATRNGLPIQIEVTDADNNHTFLNKITNPNEPLKIFAESPIKVDIGNSNPNMTLSLANIGRTEEGYTVKPIGNECYTILPVERYEEYYRQEDGNLDAFAGNFSVSISKNSSSVSSSYVKLIGITADGHTVDKDNTTDPITSIGIAIANVAGASNVEDTLENSVITLSYTGATDTKTVNVKIVRKALSTLVLEDTTSGKGESYSDIVLGKVKAGPREQGLTSENVIGYEISKQGSNNTWDIRATATNSTYEKYYDSPDGKVGMSTKTQDGIAELTFWAKEVGKYSVTPYVLSSTGNKIKLNGSLTADVSENTDVTNVALKYNGNVQSEVSGKIELAEVNINLKQKYDVIFYHQYYRNGSPIENRQIEGVVYDRVVVDIIEDIADYSKHLTVNLVSTSNNQDVIIDPSTASGGSINSLLIKKLQVLVEKPENDTGLSDTAEFKLKITNSDKSNVKELTKTVKVNVGPEVVADTIVVGNDTASKAEDITLYVTEPPTGTNNIYSETVTLENGTSKKIYYTLVPIKATYGSGSNKVDMVLTANDIKDELQAEDAIGKVAFIDNVNESSSEDDNIFKTNSCIWIKSFNDEKKPVAGESEAKYIGITVNPNKIGVIEDSEPGGWVPPMGTWAKLTTINVYHYKEVGADKSLVYKFNVNIHRKENQILTD